MQAKDRMTGNQAEHDTSVIECIQRWRARPIAGSWSDLALWMNAAEIPAPRGGPWQPAAVQRLAARHGIA